MRVLNWAISAPVLAAEISDHAFGAARGKALALGADRAQILVTCALEVETYCGRALWPGARTALSAIAVSDVSQPVSVMPALPDTTGVEIGAVAVRRWSDVIEDWEVSTSRKRAAGRVLLPQLGEYELSVDLDVTTAPPEAIEGVARLFAFRDVLRPGQLDVADGQMSLTGAFFKSGAAECLRPLRLNLA